MRGGVKARGHEEDDESAFVSMTDMTVSFLFIVIVLLAFFASQFNDKEVVPKSIYEKSVAERDTAEGKVATLTSELAALRAQLQAATMLLAQRNADLVASDQKLKAAEMQTATLKEQLTEVQGQLQASIVLLTKARADLSSSMQELATVDAQVQALQVQVQALRHLVDVLQEQLRLLKVPDPLEQYLAQAAATRLRILQELKGQLLIDFPDLRVEVSTDGDALRFQGEGLFQRGSAYLGPAQRKIVEAISARLNAILPCYTLGTSRAWEARCNPSLAVIEAVQIEGHTDSDGSDLTNLTLSTNRADATFAAMINIQPDLTSHMNTRNQPVLSVAGYGRWRPVVPNDSDADKSTTRRIDLRIMMHPPSDSAEIANLRAQLNAPEP